MVLTEKGLTLYPHENDEGGEGEGKKKEKEDAWMAISWGQLKDFYAGKVRACRKKHACGRDS